MIAGLAACGQTTTPSAVTKDAMAMEPVILGYALITVDAANTANPTVSVRTSSVEAGLPGLTSQTLSRPASVTFTQTADRSIKQDSTHRFLAGRLSVNNNSASIYKNVTLLAVNIPGYTKYGTSLTSVLAATSTTTSAESTTPSHYRTMVPTNTRVADEDTNGLKISSSQADYQMYDPSYISNITTFISSRYAGGTAFPYGFVAHETLSKTSRDLAPGSNTGQVTLSFASPDTTAAIVTGDVQSYTYLGLITADAVTTASADVYEADLTRACAVATGFVGSEAHGFIGQGAGGCITEQTVPDLRIAANPDYSITYASHP